ncbi:MAG: ribonuclease HII [Caldisericia bacterium]|jgi:ribonuclease HII|nr:ribonuclease HII [Caldisericia bacterium]
MLSGEKLIIGIDEAGRGALAGPLVVASFLNNKKIPEFVKDSKILTEEKREKIFKYFLNENLSFGIGIINPSFIDKNGIVESLKRGIELSINFILNKESILFDENFFSHYEIFNDYSLYFGEKILTNDFLILIDGNTPFLENYKIISIIDGDNRIPLISAASIVAKVIRDKIMRKIGTIYKDYEFDINKGYGTQSHYEKIKICGISNCHRKSFLKNLIIGGNR